jgi:hypothetical protein
LASVARGKRLVTLLPPQISGASLAISLEAC